MGWIENQVKNLESSEVESETCSEGTTEARIESRWRELVTGFEHDVEEFKRSYGSADITQNSGSEVRISNPAGKTSVLVTADLSGQVIRYNYQPEDDKTAVPEQGILTLRLSDSRVEIYSADQRLNPEQARRLILQPLLFPDRPEELRVAG